MNIAQRAATKVEKFDFFIHALPGGGKTGFILDSYWEHEGRRGGPLIFDFDQGGCLATMEDMGLADKIPVVQPQTEEEILYSCLYPKEIVEQVHSLPGFEDYQVDIFAYDTVSSMEEMWMGEARRQQKPSLPASLGSGIMSAARKREDPMAPAMQDYKAINVRTKSFIRHVRELPIHTIITCHTIRKEKEDSSKGLSVREEDKVFGYFPDLYGNNRYTGPKYHDFYLYMFERGGKFFASTQTRGGAAARTKYMSKFPAEIAGPSFWQMVADAGGKRFDTATA